MCGMRESSFRSLKGKMSFSYSFWFTFPIPVLSRPRGAVLEAVYREHSSKMKLGKELLEK